MRNWVGVDTIATQQKKILRKFCQKLSKFSYISNIYQNVIREIRIFQSYNGQSRGGQMRYKLYFNFKATIEYSKIHQARVNSIHGEVYNNFIFERKKTVLQ